jgi:hypothetical protein
MVEKLVLVGLFALVGPIAQVAAVVTNFTMRLADQLNLSRPG